MSQRDWINGIALGLVSGLSVAAVAGTFWFMPPSGGEKTGGTEGKYSQGENQGIESTGFWRTYTTPRDTYAQWIMAFLTLAGVMMLWRTLYYTRRTLREARDATQAAQEAVTVTREIGEAQVRAYLTIEDASVSFDPQQDGVGVWLKYSIRNCGQSPAQNVTAYMRIWNNRASNEIILPDIAAGEVMSDTISQYVDDLPFAFGSDTNISIQLVVIVKFRTVFHKRGAREEEGADFVGMPPLVRDEWYPLKPAGRGFSDILLKKHHDT